MNTVFIAQGEMKSVPYGSYITNGATTSCALVVAFIDQYTEVMCFHWPGFDTTDDYYLTQFQAFLPKEYEVENIIVITNGFAFEGEKAQQVAKVNRLKEALKANEIHYYVCSTVQGTPGITLLHSGEYEMTTSFVEVSL